MTSKIKPEAIEFWIVELLSEGATRSEALEFFYGEMRRKAIARSDFDRAKKLINERFEPEEWENHLGNLIRICQSKGYKKAWVIFRFIELYPIPSKWQLRAIAEALGFNEKWIKSVTKSKL